MTIKPIGVVKAGENGFQIVLDPQYKEGLTNIEGFSHLQIVWWGNLYDTEEARSNILIDKPYKKGPEKLGVFGTRSPVRPNPILLTNIYVSSIDHEKGIIDTPYIDAENNTPVLDIKPYHMSERIKDCNVPDWCKSWPQWDEETASFDWGAEFNF